MDVLIGRIEGRNGDTTVCRSDKVRHDRMVELVERMLTADGLRLTACGLCRMWCQKPAGAVGREP